ncbi:hypothetical protein HJFPF1_06736 [Paramyrothecium foliicola]|nr:hypothetical protein HJFPF1_06736 [Paramyrothecium foliicola]
MTRPVRSFQRLRQGKVACLGDGGVVQQEQQTAASWCAHEARVASTKKPIGSLLNRESRGFATEGEEGIEERRKGGGGGGGGAGKVRKDDGDAVPKQ